MNHNELSTITTEPPTTMSLADLVQLIAKAADLTPAQKRDMSSAICRVAELVSPNGQECTADPAVISGLLKNFSPALSGMSARTFINTKSLVRRAFKYAGLMIQPGRNQAVLEPTWISLLELIFDGWDRRRLSRFAHYATQQGWTPGEITSEHMLRYLAMLEAEALNIDVRKVYLNTCKTWNKLTESVPGWPGKAVASQRRRDPYMVSKDALPPSLRAEIEAYLDALAGGDDPMASDVPVFLKGINRRSLSPVTLTLRLTQIMQYVSALVEQGYELDKLASVDTITNAKAISAAMDFFFNRAGEKLAPQIESIGMAIRGLLHHHITGHLLRRTRRDKHTPPPSLNTLVDPRIELLNNIIDEARPQDRGLKPKNKRCLNQFEDSRNVAALLHLPKKLLKEAVKADGKVDGTEGARLAETALVIELLLMCPIRIGNVVGLDLSRHFIKSHPGKGAVIHLAIPKNEVKNDRDLEFELPDALARMLNRHIKLFRPRLPGAGSNWLFPSTTDGPRSYKIMAGQISRTVYRRTGLKITPHQFRHLGGKLFLSTQPTGHETVRQVLGHASIDTTTLHYTGIDQVNAGKTYDRSILGLRDRTKFVISKKRKSS